MFLLAGILLLASGWFAGSLWAQSLTGSPDDGNPKEYVYNPSEFPHWASGTGIIVGLCGGPVFGIWVAWYVLAKRMPSMERTFREQLEKMEERHVSHSTMMITNFREDQRNMWIVKKESDAHVIKALDAVCERLDGGTLCKFKS